MRQFLFALKDSDILLLKIDRERTIIFKGDSEDPDQYHNWKDSFNIPVSPLILSKKDKELILKKIELFRREKANTVVKGLELFLESITDVKMKYQIDEDKILINDKLLLDMSKISYLEEKYHSLEIVISGIEKKIYLPKEIREVIKEGVLFA